MLRRFLVTFCLALLSFVVSAQAPSLPARMLEVQSVEGITEYRLPNGLRVLIVPDDSKPTTTVNLTYRVGSRHEGYGETGMAHLLEHLLFKGSKKHPNVWAEFNKRGLAANGTTSFDRTNYFASFAANEANLQWILDWLADSMVNSFIAKKDLDSEMTVVRNEMEKGENDPNRIIWQRTLSLMFDWHNYGNPTIGARSDVENVDIARLKAFYRLYYQPDNAVLSVSGKFDVARTLALIARSFGPIPKPRRQLPVLYTLEPVKDGEREFKVRRVGGTQILLAGYHMPAAAAASFAAAEALSIILSDEPSGRLHKALVQKQLAASVWAWAWDLADPGVMLIGARLAPGQDEAAARRALLETVESFASAPITAEELERAKAKWLKAWDQRFTNPEQIGVALSESVAQGDWRLFFLMRDRVKALTVDEVQKLAVERLLFSNRTLGHYVPTPKPERAPPLARVDVAAQFDGFKPQAALAIAESFEATPANIDARTQRFEIGVGDGGKLQVALLPKATRGGALSAQLVLRFGDERSLSGQVAAVDLLAPLLDKGTAKLSRQQIQDRLDALRTDLSISGSPGEIVVGLTSRRETLAGAIELVGELLREPALDAAVLEEIRRQALAALQQARQQPGALAENQLARHSNPYPRGDVRHARTFDEIEADLKAVTVEHLSSLHRRLLGASYAQFGAAGDIDVPAVRAALERAFGEWKSAEPFQRVPQPLVALAPTRFEIQTPDKPNAVLLMRQPLPLNDTHADYPAFLLANWLLGGGGGDSRLWKRIREREGLSYSVQSYLNWNQFELNSPWSVSAIYAPSNRAKVEAAVQEEVDRALKEGFTEAEVRGGIGGLLNIRRLGRAQDSRLASALANNLYLGRSFALSQKVDDEIGKLTAAQVNDALRKYVDPTRFVFALAGDFRR